MIVNKKGIVPIFFLVVLAGAAIGKGRLTQEVNQSKDTLNKPQPMDTEHKRSTEPDIEGEEEVEIGIHGRD